MSSPNAEPPYVVHSSSDIHLPTLNEEETMDVQHPLKTPAASSTASFPAIYEMPAHTTYVSSSGAAHVPHRSGSSSSVSFHQPRRSSTQGPHERQLSILDPMSDRVSTILVWQNLTVQARENKRKEFFKRMKSYKNFVPKRKCLLNNINGAIAGGLWAVIGPSGSGKSTLLNTLACRLDVNTVVEGEMRLNGAPYDNAELKRIAGYVMQDDLLNGYLTVEETLTYTARLRLARTFTDKERRDRVADVMADLGLSHVHNVIVGTPLKKGISGGERKRVCVGMQLLNRPQLLFLDEPTSGLDSVTALDLLRTFHALAHGKSQEKAVTIVCSIHQPQAKIFNLFDSLILLKAGNIMYQGPRKHVMEVYRAAGFPCPVNTNPADHLLDVITPPRGNPILGTTIISLEQQQAIDEAILRHQPPLDIDLNMGVNKRLVQMNNLPLNPTWLTQVQILLRRTFQEQFRQSRIILTSLIQTIVMAVLIGTVYLKIGNTQKSTLRREPALFFCAVNQGVFGALMVINSFPVERTLTLRERASGTYFASAYFTAKIIAETLIQIPVPIIFSAIVYFLIGFQVTAGKFFIFMLFMLLCSLAATSLALLVSAVCKTTDMSVTVLPLVLEISRLFGGFFLAPSRLPKYFAWLDALSYIKYTFVGLSLNELEGLVLICTDDDRAKGSCTLTGEQTIKELGFDYITIGGCIGTLIAYIVFCRIMAFLGVRFLKN
ncbi:unnamed protein product [Adineta ricciae]|uniref:ABC transporter domain-containing protein n=1 Tax=Adineta ricciae TaxID=249248 RepID=A0A814JTQ1_ADIRI|nr:unnamed protein product [Adineta ricciae]CAF1042050.1 unnamed protein product [Adineta ricciae]